MFLWEHLIHNEKKVQLKNKFACVSLHKNDVSRSNCQHTHLSMMPVMKSNPWLQQDNIKPGGPHMSVCICSMETVNKETTWLLWSSCSLSFGSSWFVYAWAGKTGEKNVLTKEFIQTKEVVLVHLFFELFCTCHVFFPPRSLILKHLMCFFNADMKLVQILLKRKTKSLVTCKNQ